MQPATQAAVQALQSALTSFVEELIRFLDSAVELFIAASLASASLIGERAGAEAARRLAATCYAGLDRVFGRDLDDQWRQVAAQWSRAY